MWTGKQLAWKGSLTITLEDKNRAALNFPAFFTHKRKETLTDCQSEMWDIILQYFITLFIVWNEEPLAYLTGYPQYPKMYP